ncbi:MAG: phenylalanine--tRNA ligase subunit beta [Oscillospiraceae bacterium]|jgi:phenylalanyl-tRNA synthetase beta chain|nr:phenylalanine--tRNA ligase subunit beta [Oscillospiraceae bacterium]
MNLSRKWLSDFTEITADSKEYADAMTLSGSKVELTAEPSREIKNVLVGRVVKTERHPDSDHLWVVQVDVAAAEPVQIVTGAQNVREGDLVPVALHKALLPGGKKIEKGSLRGVKSNGMLCSLSELNLDLHDFPYAVEDGIFILSDDPELSIVNCQLSIGEDIRPVIGADDSVVEFEITSNRPDCLSVIGLARESAAAFDTALKLPEPRVKGGGGDIAELLSVEIQNAELCPRYTARVVRDIKIEPSPIWMRRRLRAAGVRPINNLVDITNYVMLEYGQPMHAFDYACLDGKKIVVRSARAGERMNTLDGTPRTLTPDVLVIADGEKAVGVAGVMGGENSEITGNTKYAVFESASFNGVSVRKTAFALGMRTDASVRFEKGLDIENTYPAIQRACELVEKLGAGVVCDGVIDICARAYAPVTLKLEPEKINRLLGTDIPREFMVKTLEKLGFSIEGDDVAAPSWRGDVEHYSDLAEEVARFYGYNVIEPTIPGGAAAAGGLTARQTTERGIGQLARGMGFSEICTYSFIGVSDYDKAGLPPELPIRESVTILNPLGEDTGVMRTTPLPSMLETLARNRSCRNENVKLYELAPVYRPTGEPLPDERVILTLGAYGDADFSALKGAVESILRELRVPEVSFRADGGKTSFHPGRCANIYSGETELGVLGQIHPSVAKNYGLPDAYVAELDLPAVLEVRAEEGKYVPLPRYPAVSRDLAVVCGDGVTVGALTACIRRGGGKLLREAALFDIYTGAPIPEGKKSAAFSLKLRADDRTLTDAEADDAVQKILALLKTELDAVIR